MIKNVFILYFLMFFPYLSFAQVTLIKQGILINNTATGFWNGDVIDKSVPTLLTYRNNSITSVNSAGYMLLAGDEGPGTSNNNLDGAIITGNKFSWNGENSASVITHGVFTGYNKNLTVRYNYLKDVPYGLLFKSGTDAGVNMTFTSGGCAYNICKNGKFAVRMKGMNGVKVYNNTFYSGDNSAWCLLLITSNADRTIPAPSTGTEVFNNIFYTTSLMPMLSIESSSLTNFKCDYNVYWCDVREPIFAIDGINITWEQWQARGYDTHSKVINPNFINTIDFVPSTRLDYGTNLGAEWQAGLSITAQWVVGAAPANTNQNGTWQVGARVYRNSVTGISVTGTGGANTITTDNGSLQLSAEITPTDAENQTVTWSVLNETGKASISSAGLVTAEENGTVKAIAIANDGSETKGELQITISNQKILIQEITIVDNLANDTIKGIGTKLALSAIINPSNATNKSILWTVENLTGKATIDTNGLLTTISQGTINVIAKTNDGSETTSMKSYKIAIPVTVHDLEDQDKFRIFPNPAHGKIQIQIDELPFNGVTIEIANMQGLVLEKKRVFERLTEWPIAQYSYNMLFVTVISGTNSATKKIIVGQNSNK